MLKPSDDRGISIRVRPYKSLAAHNGEDDPLTSPDLAQVLGPMMKLPAGR
jgi:hypothetical protein